MSRLSTCPPSAVACAVLACLLASSGAVAAVPPEPPAPRDTWILTTEAPAAGIALPPAASDAAGRRERRAIVVDALVAAGSESLSALEGSLRDEIDAGEVRLVARFPAFGMLAVAANDRAASRLAGLPGVMDLRPVRERRLPSRPPSSPRSARLTGPAGIASPSTLVPAAEATHLGRIGAPRAWELYGGAGEGLVIGVIDSGADGGHPALAGRFRGRRERRADRDWADLTLEARADPSDGNGHGTHVTGLAIGRGLEGAWGAGPGAEWIAARAFDAQGETDDLTLLRAADWMLRPGRPDGLPPDARAAPDIVNASWTLDNGADPLFHPVLESWLAADILPVFATGNREDLRDPWRALMAPAGDPLALAVGALGRGGGEWTWSRGGPGFHPGSKPDLLAPGEDLVSTLPGGETGPYSGSSMAAPLASGAAAAVWGLAPGLAASELKLALVAAADAGPGAGRLNVERAAELATRLGFARGRVLDADGRPVAGASVAAELDAGAPEALRRLASAAAGPDGAFRLVLPAGRHRLQGTAGDGARGWVEVDVAAGREAAADVQFAAGPQATLRGQVLDPFGQPLAGARLELRPVGRAWEPLLASSAPNGAFQWRAAPGEHVLWLGAPGAREVTRTVTLRAGEALELELRTAVAPRTLLVDADAWDRERIAPYLSRALGDVGATHQVWSVDTVQRLPSAADLTGYDVVWWAHHYGSPGRLDRARGDKAAAGALEGFLESGGRLVLSGQDVALQDDKRDLARGLFRALSGATLQRDRSWNEPTGLSGEGLLAGLRLDAAWPGGAAKVRFFSPDSLAAAPDGPSPEALLRWGDGGIAAVGMAGDERFPGRRAFLGLGPESAGGRADLARLAGALVGWLEPARLRLGLGGEPVVPGGVLTARLDVAAGQAREPAVLRLAWPQGLEAVDAAGATLVTATEAEWALRPRPGEVLALRPVLRWRPGLALPGRPAITATLLAGGRREALGQPLRLLRPELGVSALTAEPQRIPGSGRASLRLRVANSGEAGGEVAVVVNVPAGAQVDAASLRAGRGRLELDAPAGALRWTGQVGPADAVELTWAALLPASPALHAWRAELQASGSRPLILAAMQRVGGPDLTPSTLDGPPDAVAGQALTLTLRVRNAGGAAEAATARLLPAPDGAPPWEAMSPAGGAWSGAVPAGGSVDVPFVLRAPQAPISRTAALAFELDDGIMPRAALRREATVPLAWADLSGSSAEAEPAELRAGDSTTITLRVANRGPAAAEAVVTDLLPGNLVPDPLSLSPSSGKVEQGPGQLRWTVTVAPGVTETLRYGAKSGGSQEANRVLAHTVRILGGARPVVLTPTLLLNRWSWARAELITWPPAGGAGRPASFTLRLRGEGLAPPRSVAVAVDLPEGLILDGRSLSGGLRAEPRTGGAGQELRYDGPLDRQGELRLEWSAAASPALLPGARLTTLARVAAPGLETLRLAHGLPIRPWDLAGSAHSATRIVLEPGGEVGLELLVANAGPQSAAIALDYEAPQGLDPLPGTLVTEGGPPARWDGSGRAIRWSGLVAAGGRLRLRFQARFMGPGTVDSVMRFADGDGTVHERAVRIGPRRARIWLGAVSRP